MGYGLGVSVSLRLRRGQEARVLIPWGSWACGSAGDLCR